jgi:hypothetical protein
MTTKTKNKPLTKSKPRTRVLALASGSASDAPRGGLAKYTRKTHPWRGKDFIIHEPGTYYLDGKPYCPTSWIITAAVNAYPCSGTIAVQNTREACVALIKAWGAKIFQPNDRAEALCPAKGQKL